MTDMPIEQMLADIGFEEPASQAVARDILYAAGLTRPGKQRIATDKRERIIAALAEAVVGVCLDSACQAIAGDGPLLTVAPAACSVCGGGDNRRAAAVLVDRCAAAGLRRVLIIGGTPVLHRELDTLLASALELRYVDGASGTHNERSAAADMAWAEVAAIWASTPLPHKVSNLYTARSGMALTLTVPRRGIAALCCAIAERLG